MYGRKSQKKKTPEVDVNIWNQILAEAMQEERLGKSNLILLGNRGSGKRTLVSKLQKIGYHLAESLVWCGIYLVP